METIDKMISAALHGHRRARKELGEAIWDLCTELPTGKIGGGLAVRMVDVECTQNGCLGSGWRVVMGSARALMWNGRVVERSDASFFDFHNMQREVLSLATHEYEAATMADLRECAAALPQILAAWIETQHAETAAAKAAIGTLDALTP